MFKFTQARTNDLGIRIFIFLSKFLTNDGRALNGREDNCVCWSFAS